MARMLWLNWSGGGNLPPSLGVARAWVERGHDGAANAANEVEALLGVKRCPAAARCEPAQRVA
jgi:hypothetical protein